MEALLTNVVAKLEAEEDALLPNIKKFLYTLDDHVNQERLKQLLIYRRDVATFQRKVDATKTVLSELLNK
jgi:hypothetical protein